MTRSVVFPQCFPAFLYDLHFIIWGKEEIPPTTTTTKLRGSAAESDTLNLISASHLFSRCRHTMTGGNGGSVFTRTRIGDTWPKRPSSVCVITLPRCPGSHSSPRPPDKQTTSSFRSDGGQGGAGSCSEWQTLPCLHEAGASWEMGLILGKPGFWAQSGLCLGSPTKPAVLSHRARSPKPAPVRQAGAMGTQHRETFSRGFPFRRL